MPQCQFPIFCCFCVSTKLHRKYSWNWTKQKPNIQILNEASRRPKRRQRWARGWPHHQGVWARPWPRRPMVRATWSTSDAAPSPIKAPRWEKPKHPINFPETHHDPLPSSTRDREGLEALPDTLPARGITTGGLFHRHTCLRHDEWVVYLGYGSIAVARWLSSPPCASCLDLMSCLTWSRSPLCNSTYFVCWDLMNISVMIELMCWILSYVISMLFMILHALRC
jgi:hypothetical protein